MAYSVFKRALSFGLVGPLIVGSITVTLLPAIWIPYVIAGVPLFVAGIGYGIAELKCEGPQWNGTLLRVVVSIAFVVVSANLWFFVLSLALRDGVAVSLYPFSDRSWVHVSAIGAIVGAVLALIYSPDRGGSRPAGVWGSHPIEGGE